AIEDLSATFGPRYPRGAEFLQRLGELEPQVQPLSAKGAQRDAPEREAWTQLQQQLTALRNEALLANPLLDFDRLLLVKRGNNAPELGLPRNWQSNSSLAKTGFDDEIAVLSPVRPDGQLSTLFKPEGGRFVGDVELDFEARKLLFSMPDDKRRWQVFEIQADGTGLRPLTGEQPDVDSYDACYLPDGRIMFTSTGCFIGVPCVYGGSHVAVLYSMDADGKNIRQLCFDQEHDWCPTVLNNGRVLYSRWEYTDTPHSNTRLLFHMNPDGTGQMEYLGSNSYWPNSFFYARPIPGHATKVISVIGGHHDHPRMGELVLFDPALGRHEATGAVQRIPGYGKPVESIIRDGLTSSSWPKFLHPYPLSDKYFLVSCKPTPQSLWGVYLVDVFDNFVPLKQLPDFALLEPIPLRPTPRPPVIPDKVDLSRNDAVVYLPDIYAGDGLKGVPRGTVKQMRVFTYHFSYQGMGGLLGVIGMDGPWDIKRVLGTVPVNPDGSAKFRIPANTPVSLQPLDDEGQAIQLMRSWMTAMPGETVQCTGCHERQNTAPPLKSTLALNARPAEIQPWHGPTRGFSYPREVQPVVDRHCVGCHNGQPRPDGTTLCDLRGTEKIKDWKSVTPGNGGGHGGKFSVGYAELHRFVRRPGIESDYHVLEPMEFHAGTTQLVQMLKRGHHGVQLDAEAWDRLITWIDLNCPYHGTWGEELANPGMQRDRRRELLKLYANVEDDPEAVPDNSLPPIEPIIPPQASPVSAAAVDCPDWPFDAAAAKRRQAEAAAVTRREIDLGDGLKIELVLVPAGEFVMGSSAGGADEQPACRVRIERPFWMASCEISNRVFARFDPDHDSRVEDKNTYQFGIHGYPANQPEQPVVRIAWNEAQQFCRWLSQQTGESFTLPSEAQWEWACRAGSSEPFFFGGWDADFSPFANLADAKLSEFASNPYTVDSPLANPTKYDDWIPKDTRFHDGALLTVAPGRYQPNAWGLYDLHGNAAEWTRTTYLPYPYATADGRDAGGDEGRKVVRGGSWRDEPKRSTASARVSYSPWQRVYNVSFRVMCETGTVLARR
nr:SUMF1/EgtB/PvdO family nonheme iron enzyme [Pirellulaceae bacterium]